MAGSSPKKSLSYPSVRKSTVLRARGSCSLRAVTHSMPSDQTNPSTPTYSRPQSSLGSLWLALQMWSFAQLWNITLNFHCTDRNHIFTHVHMCVRVVCSHEYMFPWRPGEGVSYPRAGVMAVVSHLIWNITWVLCRISVCTLNHGAVSLALRLKF